MCAFIVRVTTQFYKVFCHFWESSIFARLLIRSVVIFVAKIIVLFRNKRRAGENSSVKELHCEYHNFNDDVMGKVSHRPSGKIDKS